LKDERKFVDTSISRNNLGSVTDREDERGTDLVKEKLSLGCRQLKEVAEHEKRGRGSSAGGERGKRGCSAGMGATGMHQPDKAAFCTPALFGILRKSQVSGIPD
jgi:hypothetical protein